MQFLAYFLNSFKLKDFILKSCQNTQEAHAIYKGVESKTLITKKACF
ncbi:MAG: hypothetical protein SPJ16_08360 [Helicobacter sp.]|nr:hypothetical protein [Helicobacter sp.]MDY5951185.1 hypothetical protein [Helicobacter sp.]